nr:reverse transcriptase domain-containing protein [Tanacetum cinerariifolium]
MAKVDEEETAFITSQGIFCYSKMLFGLKNVGATYQRLVDKAFQKQIGQNLEVYVDDLVIKSRMEQEVIVNGDSIPSVASASSEDNTSSTNETFNTAYGVSAASFKDQTSTASYADDVMFSFFSNQSNAPQLDNEDLEQIDTNDLEEMDLKWSFARECMAPRNQENRNRDAPTRNVPVDTSNTNSLVVQDGIGGYDWSFQAEEELTNFALIAHTLSSSSSDYVYDQQRKAFNKSNQEITDLKNQLENALKEKDDLKLKLEKFETSSKNLTKLIDSQISATDKIGLGYDGHANKSEVLNNVVNSCESDRDDNQVNDRFKKSEGYHALPIPYTENYMPLRAVLSFAGLDSVVFKSSALIIKDWESDREYENMFEPKEVKKTVKPSLKKIEFVNARNTTVENENKAEKPRKAAASVSTVRHVRTVASRPNVNNALPATYSYFKAHSPIRRPFNQKSTAKPNNFNKQVNTAKVNNVTTVGPKAIVSAAGEKGIMPLSPQNAEFGAKRKFNRPYIQRKNKSYLTDYQEIDGGFVAFRGNAKGGKITGKENSVLFTDTKYVILSPDFKLLDESQVMLKIPRNNNMYSLDLKNVIPVGGLTCLFANATLDESNLWHRRLGHINFKTMNKLMRGNLARGLPSKIFENDHTCVACQKGKQHKALCKTKIVSSI